MAKTIVSKKWFSHLTILFITVLGFFLYTRFFMLPERIIFDWDQENYARQIHDFVVDGNPTLLGPRTTNATGFYLAPYFTYLMVPFYLLTNLHPWGSMYFIIFYNLLFAGVSTYLITRLFSFKHAIFFLLFWTFHSYMIELDVVAWWPVLLPVGILATIFLLYKITQENKYYWWLLLGVTSGLLMNMHFQFIFILFFIGVFFITFYWKQKMRPWNHFGLGIVSTLVMFTPLLLFDLVNPNKFLNLKLFTSFFGGAGSAGSPKSIDNWVPVFANFMQPFIGLRENLIAICFFFIIGGMVVWLIKHTKDFYKTFYIATLAMWLLFPIVFALYGQRPSEYYFIFLLPFVILVLTDFIIRIKYSRALYVLAVFYIAINAAQTQERMRTEPFGLYTKDKTAKYLNEHFNPDDYNVSFDVQLGREPGFRYVLEHYNIVTHDKGDGSKPLVEIRIPPKENDVRITDDIGLKIPSTLSNGK